MKQKNKYQKFSKISEQKFREIIRCFALDLTASNTAKMTGVGASGKTIVFGILKRNGVVCTEIVPDASKSSLINVICGHITADSEINTDGLVDMGYGKHYRVRHGANEFARDKKHINGIESFWCYVKGRLSKFHGIQKEMFYLHLKETEFRFDHCHEDSGKILMRILRNKLI